MGVAVLKRKDTNAPAIAYEMADQPLVPTIL